VTQLLETFIDSLEIHGVDAWKKITSCPVSDDINFRIQDLLT